MRGVRTVQALRGVGRASGRQNRHRSQQRDQQRAPWLEAAGECCAPPVHSGCRLRPSAQSLPGCPLWRYHRSPLLRHPLGKDAHSCGRAERLAARASRVSRAVQASLAARAQRRQRRLSAALSLGTRPRPRRVVVTVASHPMPRHWARPCLASSRLACRTWRRRQTTSSTLCW